MNGNRENLEKFKDVIGVILNNWSGLKLAIEHGMAGGFGTIIGDKLYILIDRIAQVLIPKNTESTFLEDVIDETMDDLFNTVLDDSSSEEIALLITDLAVKWQNGDSNTAYEYISSLQHKENIINNYPSSRKTIANQVVLNQLNKQEVVTDIDVSDSNISINNDVNDSNDLDDGWQVVKRR